MTATTDAGPVEAGPTDPQERAREGLEHLQAAARELIHAARAMLDVAEAMVDDPEAVTQLVGALGTVGDVVRQAAAAGVRPARRPAGDGAAADAGAADGTDRTDRTDRTDGAPADGARRRSDSGRASALQRIAIV
jgi:hypothetical protein